MFSLSGVLLMLALTILLRTQARGDVSSGHLLTLTLQNKTKLSSVVTDPRYR